MKQFLFISVVMFLSVVAMAQESVVVSGGNAHGASGSVSYTVGQTSYISVSGESGTEYQGVQQPYEITEITSVQGGTMFNITLHAYPNPTSDYLTLSIVDDDFDGMECQMFDIAGKMLSEKKLYNTEVQLDMQSLPAATYFVRILKGKTEVKTFKVVKK